MSFYAGRLDVGDPSMNATTGRSTYPHRMLALLLLALPIIAGAESIQVGDIEIDPDEFSATRDPGQRIAACLSCHGQRAGGDRDFGPGVQFGTPALRGMRKGYLRESLLAYRSGARKHDEMSIISAMLDEETMEFMAHAFAAYPPAPMRPDAQIKSLVEKDDLFRRGQEIAAQGVPHKAVPPCMTCHGFRGEGSEVGPRLAGQNALYIERQFSAFFHPFTKGVQIIN